MPISKKNKSFKIKSMKTKNRQIISLENMENLKLTEFTNINGNGFGYDISYLIGYGFAMMTDLMGDHTSKYGLAFK